MYGKKVSWKTTACGVITGLAEVLKQQDHPTLQLIGQILFPIGLLCTGFFARDYDKSTSETLRG